MMNKSPSQNNKLKLNCGNDEQFASSTLCLIHIYINKKNSYVSACNVCACMCTSNDGIYTCTCKL